MSSTEELPFDVDAVTEAALEAADAAGAEAAEDNPPSDEAKEDGSKTEGGVMADGGITLEEEDEKPDPTKAHEIAAAAAEAIAKAPKRRSNQPKKRNRRVGQYGANKVAKLEEEDMTPGDAEDPAEEPPEVENETAPTEGPTPAEVEAAAGTAVAMAAEGEGADQGNSNLSRVVTKHDEKWNGRYDQLLEYKAKNGHTMVPQCYHDDPRLGRWVHYQRVEYWIYQQSGSAKITKERIARLNAIGFEWDPQKVQWDMMFDKLKQFKDENGHCRVPKGYAKDAELANWVRNQRLEEANRKKLKKSRMTDERFKRLDDLGFRWSNPTPSRSKNKDKKNEVDTVVKDATDNEHVASNGDDNHAKEETVDASLGVEI